MQPFKAIRKQLINLAVYLGFVNAPKWGKQSMVDWIHRLPDLVDENTDSGKHTDLLESLIEAVETGKPIQISKTAEDMKMSDEAQQETATETATKRPAKKKATKKKVAAAKPAKKSAKKKAAKKTAKPAKAAAKKKPGNKQPGVVATMLDTVAKASKTKPVTQEEILNVLVRTFPDRDPVKMEGSVRIITHFAKQKGIKLGRIKNEGQPVAYYIEKSKK